MKTLKYRIKDRTARKALALHAKAVNQVWNWCVAQHRDTLARYRAGAKPRLWQSHFDLAKTLKGYGREVGLHQQSICCVTEQWSRNRSDRFRASFGARRSLGWVPFQRQSRQVSESSVTYLGRTYRVFGAKRRPIPADAKGGHFVEDRLGRWWVCLLVEASAPANDNGREVGIDLGLKDFATLSDGGKFSAPQAYRSLEQKIAIAQRAGNKRFAARLHDRAANVRRDFHHKLSTSLARDYAFIAVGNVNASRLKKTRFAKSVSDAGWSAFRAMLQYKAARFVEADERFTTQTCSSCGCLPPERPRGIAGLGIRSWECSVCGESHDRDVNAARNILRIGRSAAPLGEDSRRVA